MVSAVLNYAPPARPKWLLRTLVIILIIAAGAAIGAAIGDWIQPDLYIFNGALAAPSSGAAADMAAAKQAHIAAIRGGKARVEEVAAEVGEKGREALQDARDMRDTLANALLDSIKTRPYTTLALALGAGFLFGAAWRR